MRATSDPAAFRRLCVETVYMREHGYGSPQPPSGGCVLKHLGIKHALNLNCPAAFRRLCVETRGRLYVKLPKGSSRLQAAVC